MSSASANPLSRGLTHDPALGDLLDRLAARAQAGERVDIDEVAQEHPAYADELRRLLPAVLVLAELSRPGGSEGEGEAGPGGVAGRLGDFRIVREVARGGMGIVYEAEQVSLGRRVALKVLPLAATLDPRRLQRFQNEARAAAFLHHTNIVPVYAVGSERGVHYYAMQFIDGQSLAALIRERKAKDEGRRTKDEKEPEAPPPAALHPSSLLPHPSPAYFRRVAELGAQAAEALDYAHQVGVVHRDIKPANLLVDARGDLWVTDFGLAQFLQGEAGLTGTGDVVGTLRYMSPEQALARRGVIDHRTDVYSLGATLYELLTLRPAFPGNDRQDLLRRIAAEDPTRPRRLDPRVPAELETVITKAMEKHPADRYATARELADDLRRFLEHQPIRARRPGLVRRLVKWTRRHTELAAAGAVSAVLLVALAIGALVANNLAVRHGEQRAQAAYQAEARRLRQARQAVDEMYTRFAQRWLAEQGALTDVQREFLEKARDFYEEFAQDDRADPEARQEAAAACTRLGDIETALVRWEAARPAYERAIEILEHLAAEYPDRPQYRAALAGTQVNLGTLHLRREDRARAGAHYGKALRLLTELAAAAPGDVGYRKDLILCHNGLAMQLAGTDPAAAADHRRQAFDLAARLADEFPHDPSYQDTLAGCYMDRGDHRAGRAGLADFAKAVELLTRAVAAAPDGAAYRNGLALARQRMADRLVQTGAVADAEAQCREALKLRRQLADSFPRLPEFRQRLATSYNNLAVILKAAGKRAEAADCYRKAIEVDARLVADYPRETVYRERLAMARTNLGLTLCQGGAMAAGREQFRQSCDVLASVLADSPRSPTYRFMLVRNHYNWGYSLQNSDPAAAVAHYRQAVEVLTGLTAELPESAEYRHEMAKALTYLGLIARKQGRLPEARRWLEEAVSRTRAACAQGRRSPDERPCVWMHFSGLADTLLRQGQHADAARLAEEFFTVFPDGHPVEYTGLATLLVHCADAAARDEHLPAERRRPAAAGYEARAREALREAARRCAGRPATQNELAWVLAASPDPRLRDPAQAVALAEQATAAGPREAAFWNTLGVARYRAGQWEPAVRALDKSTGLSQGGGPADWLFLAMAHHRLGHRDQARLYYDRAARWMEQRKPADEELSRFRAEAAALLRVPDRPPPRPKEVKPAKP